MTSKITIEVDFENKNLPVIQIIYQPSDDVRDKLISQFLQSFEHTSRWAAITFDAEVNGGTRWKISPITPAQLPSEIDLMNAVLKRPQATTDRPHTVSELQAILHKMDANTLTEGFIVVGTKGGQPNFYQQKPRFRPYSIEPTTREDLLRMIDEA